MNQKPPQAEGTHCPACWMKEVRHWGDNEGIPVSEPFCCDDDCPCHSNAETTVEQSQAGETPPCLCKEKSSCLCNSNVEPTREPSQAVSSSKGEAVEPWRDVSERYLEWTKENELDEWSSHMALEFMISELAAENAKAVEDYKRNVVAVYRTVHVNEADAILAAERARVGEEIAVEIEAQKEYRTSHMGKLTLQHAATIARTHAKKDQKGS